MIIPGDLLLTQLAEVVTNDPDRDGMLGVVDHGAVAMVDGRVAWVGPEADLPSEYRYLPPRDCEGRTALPGFVDAHTHLVFAGHRAGEFGRRLRGERYEDILAGGGGIQSTVAATRAASMPELVVEALVRARSMLAAGTTTVEIKSGYALDAEGEARLLGVASALATALPIDVVPTFLGAHVVPPEYRADRAGYVDLVVHRMLPNVAPLARFCDVFCDEGAFTVAEARRILEAGREHGLVPRLHADQLAATGAAALAAELRAASADHLDHASDDDLEALAAAGTAAVLLPGVSFSMRQPYVDAARFLHAGLTVAIATDANPGTSYVLRMQLVIALACLHMGMSPEQAVWSATRGGALALREEEKGTLVPGAIGDVIVIDADSYLHLPYRADEPLVSLVVKDGAVVGDSPE